MKFKHTYDNITALICDCTTDELFSGNLYEAGEGNAEPTYEDPDRAPIPKSELIEPVIGICIHKLETGEHQFFYRQSSETESCAGEINFRLTAGYDHIQCVFDAVTNHFMTKTEPDSRIDIPVEE